VSELLVARAAIEDLVHTYALNIRSGKPAECMKLFTDVPDPPATLKVIPKPSSRHRRGESYAVRAASVLGGLHNSLAAADV
jgi:hypothetical protein